MKKIVNTDRAPEPIGPYSQAVVANGFIFCSGQIGVDPETNRLKKSSVADETRQVLENLKAIVEAAGSSFENAVRATVYLTSLDYFKEMNEVYREFFPDNPPSRATVAVSNLAMGARVEIDLIVAVK